MRKGDIVLVPFPFTDLSEKKVRPALVLFASAKGQDFIVAFVSSVIPRKLGAHEISILPSRCNGLKSPSHIRLDKLATLQKNLAIGNLGTLEPASLAKVDTELRELFNL